jgi:hypothetical protein
MVAGLTEHIWTLWEVLLFWAPRCSQPSSTVSWVEASSAGHAPQDRVW